MGRVNLTYEGYDKTLIEFITSQRKSTQQVYKSFFKHILNFTKMTGEQLLESKKADKNYEWEKKVIAFKQYMKDKGLSDNSANTAVNTLRSFFDYYRTPLLFSQNENRKLNGKAHRVTMDYMLTNEDLTKLTFVADLREKYIILLGKSLGLRAGDFITLTYGTFRSINLNEETPIFMGEFQTQKEGVTAYPFIDSDALPTVKAILENNNKPNDERIVKIQENELSTLIQNLAKKANVNLGGKHLRFHCFRKYLIDRLSANMSESKWKQIVGKAISEDAYVSSFELRSAYIQAMKLTTINTNGNGKVSKLSEAVTKLQEEKETDRKNIKELVDQLENLRQEIKPLYALAEAVERTNPSKYDEDMQMFSLLIQKDEEMKELLHEFIKDILAKGYEKNNLEKQPNETNEEKPNKLKQFIKQNEP
jgi:integrase